MADRDLQELHRRAMEQFKLVSTLETDQRKREVEDLKFADPIDPSDQWPADALNARAGLPAQGTFPPVPPRPAFTINKLRQPLQQVINMERQARLSLVFAPEGDGTSVEDAAAFEDIARAIQTDSRAHLARNWAFDRAVKCGRGFYRIETEYVNNRSRDQRIVYKRIKNQASVYYDPYCIEPDFSDAQWCFITEDIPWREFKRRYPDSQLATAEDNELAGIGDQIKGWMTDTDEGKLIRVAEYFFFDVESDVLVHVPVADTGEVKGYYRSELKAAQIDESLLLKDEDGAVLQRPVERRQLRWAKMNGMEFLTEAGLEKIVERDGEYIPVVPVIADETNINGITRYTGMVRPSRDAQRLFNVEASSLAESVHLGPLSPFIAYADVIEGYESWWAQLNTRRFPYLPINAARSPDGSTLPPPQRNVAEQPIQAIALSLKEAEHYIDITTGIPPAALGQLDPHERSGKAILALQNQSQLSTSGYVDNLANMSMLLEGKILRDLIPKIYDRRGRTVAAQDNDDSRRTVMLNTPFLQQPKQPPQPVAPGTPNAKLIDLKAAEVSVTPTIGKALSTRREQEAEDFSNLAEAAPQFVPAFIDLWAKSLDGPGFMQAAHRLEKAVPPQFRDENDQQTQLAQLQQKLAMATQQLQELAPMADKGKADLMKAQMQAQADLQGKQMSEQGENQRAVLKLQADERARALDNLVKLAIAEITAKTKDAETEAENARTELGFHHEHAQNRLDNVHEAVQNELDRNHERTQAQEAAENAGTPDTGSNA